MPVLRARAGGPAVRPRRPLAAGHGRQPSMEVAMNVGRVNNTCAGCCWLGGSLPERIPNQTRPKFEPCRECRASTPKGPVSLLRKSGEAPAPDLEFAVNSVNASAAGEVSTTGTTKGSSPIVVCGWGTDPTTCSSSSLSQMVHQAVSARRGHGRRSCGDRRRAAPT